MEEKEMKMKITFNWGFIWFLLLALLGYILCGWKGILLVFLSSITIKWRV